MATLSELETLLSESDGRAHRDTRLDQLKAVQKRLQDRVAAGLGCDEFTFVQSALQATQSAQEVLLSYPVGYAAATQAAPSAVPSPHSISAPSR